MSAATSYNVTTLLGLGLLFHLVYIASVFDCYFTSPVVHGMQAHNIHPESQRLVLIVGNCLAHVLYSSYPVFQATGSVQIFYTT